MGILVDVVGRSSIVVVAGKLSSMLSGCRHRSALHPVDVIDGCQGFAVPPRAESGKRRRKAKIHYYVMWNFPRRTDNFLLSLKNELLLSTSCVHF